MIIDCFDTERRWEYENGFYLTSDPTRLGKALAHWELYKMISDLPGSVVECGVFKGVSLVQWATFRDLLENPQSRKVVGFDVFGPFPDGDTEIDKSYVSYWNEVLQGSYLTREALQNSLDAKGLRNVELVQGDILKTLPEYLEKHPELKIALLHVDTDIEAPSALALDLLYPRLVRGGVVVLDDYGAVAGGTKAVDDYFADKDVRIRKLPISHTIPAYVVKTS